MSTPTRRPPARVPPGRQPSTRAATARPVVAAAPRLAARRATERRRRRRVLLRRTAWVVAGSAPLVVLGWLLLGSSLLAVRTVTVTGTHRLTPAQVRAAAAVPVGQALARLDVAAVTRRVRALDPVLRVSVTRDWPHGVRLTVVERVPVVAVARVGGVQLLDAGGHPVARSAASGLLRLQVAHPGADDAATRAALAVLQALPPTVRSQVVSLSAASPEQVVLGLRGGRRVVWGGATDSATKAAELGALLRLPGHVYDVSAPGVVTRR